METAPASPARPVNSRPSVMVVLRDVEDLHGADLDALLADRLADGHGAAEVAASLAQLLERPGPAVLSHRFSATAELLAVR